MFERAEGSPTIFSWYSLGGRLCRCLCPPGARGFADPLAWLVPSKSGAQAVCPCDARSLCAHQGCDAEAREPALDTQDTCAVVSRWRREDGADRAPVIEDNLRDVLFVAVAPPVSGYGRRSAGPASRNTRIKTMGTLSADIGQLAARSLESESSGRVIARRAPRRTRGLSKRLDSTLKTSHDMMIVPDSALQGHGLTPASQGHGHPCIKVYSAMETGMDSATYRRSPACGTSTGTICGEAQLRADLDRIAKMTSTPDGVPSNVFDGSLARYHEGVRRAGLTWRPRQMHPEMARTAPSVACTADTFQPLFGGQALGGPSKNGALDLAAEPTSSCGEFGAERGVDVAVEPVLSLLPLDLHAARDRPGARPKGREHLGLERERDHGIVLAEEVLEGLAGGGRRGLIRRSLDRRVLGAGGRAGRFVPRAAVVSPARGRRRGFLVEGCAPVVGRVVVRLVILPRQPVLEVEDVGFGSGATGFLAPEARCDVRGWVDRGRTSAGVRGGADRRSLLTSAGAIFSGVDSQIGDRDYCTAAPRGPDTIGSVPRAGSRVLARPSSRYLSLRLGDASLARRYSPKRSRRSGNLFAPESSYRAWPCCRAPGPRNQTVCSKYEGSLSHSGTASRASGGRTSPDRKFGGSRAVIMAPGLDPAPSRHANLR